MCISAHAANKKISTQTHIDTIPTARTARDGSVAKTPAGWTDFCQRYWFECSDDEMEPKRVHLDHSTWIMLNDVNKSVNDNLTGVDDGPHWGVKDRWDYPTDGKGDCEDYALEKRKWLISRGLPRQALSLALARDTDGVGHAVLLVRTDRGDIILDDLSPKALAIDKTRYRYYKRQSATNQNIWVSFN